MDILVNKTTRVIAVDGLLLVPSKAQKVKSAEELMKRYPRLAELVNSHCIDIKSEKKAAKVEPVAEETEEKRTITRRKRG